MKIIISTLMHGRHETCSQALAINRAAGITDFCYAWTDINDRLWCVENDITIDVGPIDNEINLKANASLKAIYSLDVVNDYDAVLLMGSDDYIDSKFIEFITEALTRHDYIGWTDMMFREGDDFYFWPGYPKSHPRHGEPAGAGKVVRRDLLDRMKWHVFGDTDGGTDRRSHQKLMQYAEAPLMTSIRYEGVTLVDIKDQNSKTPLSKFGYLIQL